MIFISFIALHIDLTHFKSSVEIEKVKSIKISNKSIYLEEISDN